MDFNFVQVWDVSSLAQKYGVTGEAIRKHIRRKAIEDHEFYKKHVVSKGRKWLLDKEAVEYLETVLKRPNERILPGVEELDKMSPESIRAVLFSKNEELKDAENRIRELELMLRHEKEENEKLTKEINELLKQKVQLLEQLMEKYREPSS